MNTAAPPVSSCSIAALRPAGRGSPGPVVVLIAASSGAVVPDPPVPPDPAPPSVPVVLARAPSASASRHPATAVRPRLDARHRVRLLICAIVLPPLDASSDDLATRVRC